MFTTHSRNRGARLILIHTLTSLSMLHICSDIDGQLLIKVIFHIVLLRPIRKICRSVSLGPLPIICLHYYRDVLGRAQTPSAAVVRFKVWAMAGTEREVQSQVQACTYFTEPIRTGSNVSEPMQNIDWRIR